MDRFGGRSWHSRHLWQMVVDTPIHRRAWNPHSRSNEDDAMRRHVNRNYDLNNVTRGKLNNSDTKGNLNPVCWS